MVICGAATARKLPSPVALIEAPLAMVIPAVAPEEPTSESVPPPAKSSKLATSGSSAVRSNCPTSKLAVLPTRMPVGE